MAEEIPEFDQSGNIFPDAPNKTEHNKDGDAKRSLMLGYDGVNYNLVKVDSDGNIPTSEFAVVDTPVTSKDTSFVVGDSGVIFDANTALGRNGTQFSVFNDGAGDIDVSISNDGAAFGNEHTVESEEVYTINNVSVDSIRITHTGTDSAYRILVL